MARTKKPKLTRVEADRRRAERKAERLDARDAQAVGPLFADQLQKRDANAEYWKMRQGWANLGGAGEQAAELGRVDFKFHLWVVRNLARSVMSPEDFHIADTKRWVGDVMRFWRDVLTGQKEMVLGYERISRGWRPVYLEANEFRGEAILYVEQVDIVPTLTWPPPGWQAPLTQEQFTAMTTTPEAMDHPGAVDPLG